MKHNWSLSGRGYQAIVIAVLMLLLLACGGIDDVGGILRGWTP